MKNQILFVGFIITSSFLLGLSACSNSDLPDPFRLDRFRVLALTADKPEVNPGETVTITPFLSDISGAGRAITFSVEGCVDPGIGVGAAPTCTGNATQIALQGLTAVTGLAAPNYTGPLTSTVSVTVPAADIIFGNQTSEEQFNGVSYIVLFTFSFPDGSELKAFRRVLVSTRTTKNQNPTYDANPILATGTPISSAPSSDVDLSAQILSTSAETFEVYQGASKVSQIEGLNTAWYISDGDLSVNLTDANVPSTKYKVPTEARVGHDWIVVAVTRDDRGGDAVTMVTFP